MCKRCNLTREFDAVLLGWPGANSFLAPDAEQEERLRKLAPTGLPLLTAHPALDSMLTAYELELFVRDGQAQLAPLLPLRMHPLAAQFAAAIEAPQYSPLGKIEQITLTRHLPTHNRDQAQQLDSAQHRVAAQHRETVQQLFAQDVDLLRMLLGEVKTVLAMGSGAASSTTSPTSNTVPVNVQLSGAQGRTARWSIDPLPGEAAGTLTLYGSLQSGAGNCRAQ